MRDLVNNVSALVLIAAATYSADTTPASIDLADFNSAMILIEVGVGGITFSGTNKVEFVLTESDDNSTFTAVDPSDITHAPQVVASGIVYSLTAAHAAATVVRLGYRGTKRYLKLLADFSGTHGTGTPLSALAILGEPLTAPVA